MGLKSLLETLLQPDTSASNGTQDFAVVIGINSYKHEMLVSLQGPKNDAVDFVRWLGQGHGGNKLRKDHVIVKSPQANCSDLDSAFGDLVSAATANKGGRRLYIFVSAHGFGASIKHTGIFTSERSPTLDVHYDLIGTAGLFHSVGLFDEVIMFVDCCRDSQLSSHHPHLPPLVLQDLGGGHRRPTKRFYCFGCSFDQKLPEVPYGSKYRGVFSFNLLKILRGQVSTAIDGEGQVTAYSLMRHLKVALEEALPKMPPAPECDPNIEEELKQIVLAKGFVPRKPNLTITLSDPDGGFSIFSGKDWSPLNWSYTQRGNVVEVLKEEEGLALFISSPRMEAFTLNCKHGIVPPFGTKIVV